ncbi:MAG: SusC/RagA family TonB-linked outer membrane protein [Bacteroidales bacterium]|nr:SusC/RagA family TonB-linked outer membrane protein [Bacteroidales bacterium]
MTLKKGSNLPQQKNIAGAIKGKVTDENGEALPGVIVMNKNTGDYTSTDIDGLYSINAAKGDELAFSSIGMKDFSQLVAQGAILDVTMITDAVALDEAIVVAYGTAKRESITGAIASVNSKALEKRPLGNAIGALEGMTTGIQINNTNGEPGSAPEIRIRGYNTVNGSNAPLYIVDGMPLGGNTNDINPNDIESISVLKDAASAAMYGSRAANGVILITTKKGSSEKITVRASTNQGIYTRLFPEYEKLNAKEWMEAMWQTGYHSILNTPANAGKYIESEAAEIATSSLWDQIVYNIFNKSQDQVFDSNGRLTPGTEVKSQIAGDLDWFKPMERVGHRQEYNVSGDAAYEKSNFYFSLNYLNEQGYVTTSDFQRITGRMNASVSPKKWLKLGLNLSGSYRVSNNTSSPFYYSRNMAPIYPVHVHDYTTPDGDFITDAEGTKIYDYGQYDARPTLRDYNVVMERQKDLNQTLRNTLEGIAFADIVFLKDFKFSVKGSMSNINSEGRTYNNSIVGSSVSTGGSASRSISRNRSYTFQQQLTWNKTFNTIHDVEIFLGHENYHYRLNYLYGEKYGETLANKYDLINFATIDDLTDYEDNYKTEGYVGRAKYAYDNRVFLEASIRRDGSSRFHKDTRWGNFWSVGGSWMLSREKWMKDINWIDNLKLRASYGEVGNDGSVGLYGYMALYGLYLNDGKPASYKEQIEALDIVWESTNSFGVAVEGRFFDRFNLSVEYYDKRSKDLLFDVSLPLSSGSMNGYTPTVTKNLGSVSNRGFEFDFNIDLLRKNNMHWTFGVNASTIKNKIVRLPEEYRESGILDGTKKRVEGGGIYDYWLYQSAGVDLMTGRTLYIIDDEKYAPVKTDGKTTISSTYLVNINDQYYTTRSSYAKKDWEGSSLPDVFGSFNTNLSWGNFAFSALFTYSIGGKVYDNTYIGLMSNLTADIKPLHKDLLNAWNGIPQGITETSPNRISKTAIPALDGYNSSDNNAMSDRWLMDGSYLMVKNVSLSYRVPGSFCDRLNISGLNVTLNIENLATTYNIKGSNPQASFNGSVSSSFSTARTFSLGLNLTL